MRPRAARPLALLLAGGLALAGCTGPRPAPKGRAFALPARPSAPAAPLRPLLGPGDVAGGLLPGEAAPRICFRPEKWREVLGYVVALEAHQKREGIRLRGHIEKLEGQIREMNRFLRGPGR